MMPLNQLQNGNERLRPHLLRRRFEFQGADAKWRRIMSNTAAMPIVTQASSAPLGPRGSSASLLPRAAPDPAFPSPIIPLQITDTSGLLSDLEVINSAFIIIEKSLNAYLDSKKLLFPRCVSETCRQAHFRPQNQFSESIIPSYWASDDDAFYPQVLLPLQRRAD